MSCRTWGSRRTTTCPPPTSPTRPPTCTSRRLDDLREQLAAVERAEERLANGTYGRSVESGATIPDERLEAVPTAERTVDEEARRERGG